jgi:predicted O-methyltransferase YrrM
MGILKETVKKLPVVAELVQERDKLFAELSAISPNGPYKFFVPPGHFFSPLPELDYVKRHEAEIFGEAPRTIPGIDLREAEQLELLRRFQPYYAELPFSAGKSESRRYYFENPAYSYSDAIFLYSMIRHFKPKRIIEIGSGYSSCVMLDTNELFFGNAIDITFVEPYPELLLSLIRKTDRERTTLISSNLQEVDLKLFAQLEEHDIVFVDSTHVSKIYSDVNYIFFKLLPSLRSGVLVHFHDIFYPFEYPKEWVYENRAWNEAYLFKAFLQYNEVFRIVMFNTYLQIFHADYFQTHMPLCLKDPGGSIWIQKS